MKQDTQNGMKRVNANIDLMVVFAMLKNVGIIINAGVNPRN